MQRDSVVEDALRITTVLNRHMTETNCRHSVKEIMKEIFG
jgi:hypothetical protein